MHKIKEKIIKKEKFIFKPTLNKIGSSSDNKNI